MPALLKFLLPVVAALMVCSPFKSEAATPFAVYDEGTGGFTFRHVENIVGLRINSDSGILLAGQATDLGGAASGSLSVVNDQAPSFIEWGNLAGMSFDSEFAGNIVASSTSYSTVVSDVTFLWRGFSGSTQTGIIDIPIVPHKPSVISLQAAFDDQTGLISKAISISGETGPLEITNLTISDNDYALFGATINDVSSVDLTLDVETARALPAGTAVTADLLLESNQGNVNYTLSATVPEPVSLCLLALALSPFACLRLRSR